MRGRLRRLPISAERRKAIRRGSQTPIRGLRLPSARRCNFHSNQERGTTARRQACERFDVIWSPRWYPDIRGRAPSPTATNKTYQYRKENVRPLRVSRARRRERRIDDSNIAGFQAAVTAGFLQLPRHRRAICLRPHRAEESDTGPALGHVSSLSAFCLSDFAAEGPRHDLARCCSPPRHLGDEHLSGLLQDALFFLLLAAITTTEDLRIIRPVLMKGYEVLFKPIQPYVSQD